MLTVITPTTGKDMLLNSIESIKRQEVSFPIKHIILWDDKREGNFLYPPEGQMTALNPYSLEVEEGNYESNCIVIKGSMIQGAACGSALRAVGLMAANTEYVTFADDDILWEKNHAQSLIDSLNGQEWGFCKRAIWTITDGGEYECLGVDNFESVGEEAKTPYKMVDNNCMVFKKKYGISAACLYRNTADYNDDRQMYSFLKKYAGEPSKSGLASVNQICPDRLVDFFRKNCTKSETTL
jgi:hypothetical protein